MKAGNAWKLAMTAARRRRSQNVLQVMVFSITIMSLLILTLLRTDLIDEWQAQLPENTPNHFMMNITRNQIPDIETAFFSVLAPNKHIPRHRGEYKGLIRCHLGLIVPGEPGDCRMNVHDQTVHWEEGKFLIFDNAYHHEVWNDTDQTRVILLIDVVRPMRFPYSWINRMVIRMIGWSPYIREARRNHRKWDHPSLPGSPSIPGPTTDPVSDPI